MTNQLTDSPGYVLEMLSRLKTWLCFSIIQSFLWWLEEWCGGVYHETYKLEMIKLTKSSCATKCIRDALREKNGIMWVKLPNDQENGSSVYDTTRFGQVFLSQLINVFVPIIKWKFIIQSVLWWPLQVVYHET